LAIIRPLGYVRDERDAWSALLQVAKAAGDRRLGAKARSEVSRIDELLIWPANSEFPPLGLVLPLEDEDQDDLLRLGAIPLEETERDTEDDELELYE
jgi:hypothetical protein